MLSVFFVSRSTSCHEGSGGMEKHFESVADHLSVAHATHLVTTASPRVESSYMEKFSTVTMLQTRRPGKYSLQWWYYSFHHARKLKRAAVGADDSKRLVFSVSAAGFMYTLVGLPVIGQCHGTALQEAASAVRQVASDPVRSVARLVMNTARIPRDIMAYRKFDHVIAISEAIAAQLQRFPYRVPSNRISVVPNGVDEATFGRCGDRSIARSELGLTWHNSAGLFVGRVDYQKGADLAVNALRFTPSNTVLFVCGEGSMLSKLQRIVEDTQILRGRVFFLGRVKEADVARLASACDVALMPSRRSEGLSLTLLEMLSSKLPVIASKHVNCPKDLTKWVQCLANNTPRAIAAEWRGLQDSERAVVNLPKKYTATVSLDSYGRVVEGLFSQ